MRRIWAKITADGTKGNLDASTGLFYNLLRNLMWTSAGAAQAQCGDFRMAPATTAESLTPGGSDLLM